MAAQNEKPYEVTFRFPMSEAAHALLDLIVALPDKDRLAVTLALRAIDHVGAMGEMEGPEVVE